MKVKNIYVIRHGETDWNKSSRFQGQTDVLLNSKGQEQAIALSPLIQQLLIDAIYSSTLSRAFQTAEIATKDLQISVIKDDRLRETNIGLAEGLTLDEIIAQFGEETLAKWRSYDERLLDFRFPEGESKRQMMYRIRTVMLDLSQNTNKNNIAVFAHGMVMRAMTFIFGSGVPWDHHVFSNGSVHHFLWSDDQPDFLNYKGRVN